MQMVCYLNAELSFWLDKTKTSVLAVFSYSIQLLYIYIYIRPLLKCVHTHCQKAWRLSSQSSELGGTVPAKRFFGSSIQRTAGWNEALGFQPNRDGIQPSNLVAMNITVHHASPAPQRFSSLLYTTRYTLLQRLRVRPLSSWWMNTTSCRTRNTCRDREDIGRGWTYQTRFVGCGWQEEGSWIEGPTASRREIKRS